MRMPYLQVAMELIELAAPEIAMRCKRSTNEVVGGLVAGIKWGLARIPDDDEPPSAHPIVDDPEAGLLWAHACGFGDIADTFTAACARAKYGPIELLDCGRIRLRGLDRYDAYWGKSHAKAWEAWKAARPEVYGTKPGRNRAGTGPGLERDGAGFGPPDPDPDADTNGGSKNPEQIPNAEDPPPPRRKVAAAERKEFWDGLQANRVDAGLEPETRKPKSWADRADPVIAERGVEGALRDHRVFLADPGIKADGHPTAVFLTEGVQRTRARARSQAPPGPARAPCERCGDARLRDLVVWSRRLCDPCAAAWTDAVPESATADELQRFTDTFVTTREQAA